MAKKKKKSYYNPKMPRLTKLDKAIYIVLIVLTLLIFLSIVIGWSVIKDIIALSDNRVIAYYDRSSSLFVLPFLFLAEIIAIVGFTVGLSDRKPIFGDKNVTYGPPRYPSVYPVFMRRKPKDYVRPSHLKFNKWKRSVLLIMLISTFALVPLSFFGRVCLTEDVSIEKYNAFNVCTKTLEQEEMDTLTIRIGRIKKTKHFSRWGLYMDIKTTENKEYKFSEQDFYGFGKADGKSDLDWFEYIKSSFPDEKIFYKNRDLIEGLIEDNDYNEAEIRQVYELLDIN